MCLIHFIAWGVPNLSIKRINQQHNSVYLQRESGEKGEAKSQLEG